LKFVFTVAREAYSRIIQIQIVDVIKCCFYLKLWSQTYNHNR